MSAKKIIRYLISKFPFPSAMIYRFFLLASLSATLLLGQVYPGAVATDSDLLVARFRAQSVLTAPLSDSATTFSVAVAGTFADNMVVVIDAEQIFCTTFTGTAFSVCTRAYDGSIAVSHLSGAVVSGYLVPNHHELLKDEIIAMQTDISKGLVHDVRLYGAVCDSATDDIAAINLAIAALNTAGRGTLSFPPLGCLVDGALTAITARVAIIGHGGQGKASRLLQKNVTSNTISITSDFGFVIKDLDIDTTVTKTAGAAITIDGGTGSTSNGGGYLENVNIANHDVGMDVIDGNRITFEHCFFVSNETTGLKLQNTVALDNGLISISNSIFDNPAATENILWNSGGGLKISNSKILEADYGIDLSVVDGVSTSIFVVTGSSFEASDINAIRIRRDGTTGTLGRIVIVGNQILVDTNQIAVNFPSAGINMGVIAANVITVAGTGKGIEVADDAVDDLLIASNIFEQSSIGINVTANGAVVKIGDNHYTSVTTPWVAGTSTILSGSDGTAFNLTDDLKITTSAGVFDVKPFGGTSVELICGTGGCQFTGAAFLNFRLGATDYLNMGSNSLLMHKPLDLEDDGSKPTCDVTKRGWIWMDEGGASVADTVELCTKDSSDVYAWRTII